MQNHQLLRSLNRRPQLATLANVDAKLCEGNDFQFIGDAATMHVNLSQNRSSFPEPVVLRFRSIVFLWT